MTILLKIMTLRFNEVVDGIDDEPLRKFIAGKEIVSVRDEFFVREGVPYWAVMLHYRMPSEKPVVEKKDEKEKDEKENYRDILTEDGMAAFNFLKDYRTERAKKDGVPPFIVFKDVPLAKISMKKPTTISQLASIEGVGPKSLKKNISPTSIRTF